MGLPFAFLLCPRKSAHTCPTISVRGERARGSAGWSARGRAGAQRADPGPCAWACAGTARVFPRGDEKTPLYRSQEAVLQNACWKALKKPREVSHGSSESHLTRIPPKNELPQCPRCLCTQLPDVPVKAHVTRERLRILVCGAGWGREGGRSLAGPWEGPVRCFPGAQREGGCGRKSNRTKQNSFFKFSVVSRPKAEYQVRLSPA